MTEEFLIPAEEVEFEEEIKHSRFISFVFHCDSEQKLKLVLTRVKQHYPGASHYCYAFVADDPSNLVAIGSSDDGEPAGSAGRPMLACLQGANIGEIGAVVVRYFGGTKLGVGGLVRAYSSGIKKVIPELKTQLKTRRYPVKLTCDYAQLNDVEYVITQCEGVIIDKQFAESVTVEFELAKAWQQKFNALLATQTQGALQVKFTA
ncbi:YigZ family protein [Shewanella sp. WXL01]|uniref:YigZ family protein n=1 Tax=Shewanella sp. WXL01 TaxID=2709721 RepID=UPI0014383818|nr:YigZ family protein [Shewanella sp. WXL01]NKF51850.1 YigZ family protein [Shewanella sp. WXL01]